VEGCGGDEAGAARAAAAAASEKDRQLRKAAAKKLAATSGDSSPKTDAQSTENAKSSASPHVNEDQIESLEFCAASCTLAVTVHGAPRVFLYRLVQGSSGIRASARLEHLRTVQLKDADRIPCSTHAAFLKTELVILCRDRLSRLALGRADEDGTVSAPAGRSDAWQTVERLWEKTASQYAEEVSQKTRSKFSAGLFQKKACYSEKSGEKCEELRGITAKRKA
jgi:hypothetical protein